MADSDTNIEVLKSRFESHETACDAKWIEQHEQNKKIDHMNDTLNKLMGAISILKFMLPLGITLGVALAGLVCSLIIRVFEHKPG